MLTATTHTLKSRAARISQTHLPRSQLFSTDLEPSNSHSNGSQSFKPIQLSPSVQKKGSRLRDKAGLPAFAHPTTRTRVSQRPGDQSELTQPKIPGTLRTRTQLERAQMSHKERSIALELLEDLGIPIEELQRSTPSSSSSSSPESDEINPNSQSPITDLFQRPEFQSVLQQSSSNKNLLRHRPTQLSPEDIRLEDVLKELTDSQIQKIDSFETDFQLLQWVDEVVFSQSRRPPSTNSQVQVDSTHQSEDHNTNDDNTRLGQVFEKNNSESELNAHLEAELDYTQDPEAVLNQPLCFTPIFSPILLHLLKLTSSKLKNPYLALYLFNWVRAHPDPIVKHFGLTRETYFENLQIKWEFFKDFKGIKDDLLEMNAMGLELDERFKSFIQSITRVVWQDELDSENFSNTSHGNLSKIAGGQINLPSISQAERCHVSEIESILHDFIESQNHAFARKLRALPVESNQPLSHL